MKTIPTEVVLSAIAYRVAVHEDMIVFTHRCGPAYSRMAFTRVCGCWYVDGRCGTADQESGGVMVAHVREAQKLLSEWYGADFEGKNGEHKP